MKFMGNAWDAYRAEGHSKHGKYLSLNDKAFHHCWQLPMNSAVSLGLESAWLIRSTHP